MSGIFQLEQSEGVAEIRRIIDTLIEVLDDPELRELRRDMTTWLRRAVIPAKLPNVEVPEMEDLQEAKIMLAERAATWPKQWMAEGYRKGQAEGLRETLLAFLQEKFGSIEERHEAMVAKAHSEQLKEWLSRVLGARSTKEIFET